MSDDPDAIVDDAPPCEHATPAHTLKEATTTSPSRKVRDEKHDLGLAWTCAALAGAAVILVFSLANVRYWLASATPLLFMAWYCWFAMTRSRPSVARIADSVYFMGFWWTLWALLVTLVWHGITLEPAAVFQAFGYALFTTASGMFVRMSLLQFNQTVDDQEIEAVDSIDAHIALLNASFVELVALIAATTETLRTDFASVDSALSGAANKMTGTVSVFVEQAGIALTTQSSTLRAAVTREVEQMATTIADIRKATVRIGRGVEKQAESIEAVTKEFATSLTQTALSATRAVSDLIAKLDQIETAPDSITARFAYMTGGVDTVLANMSVQLANTTTALQEMQLAIATGSTAASRLPESIQSIAAAARTVAAEIERLSQLTVPKVNADLRILTDDVKQSRQGLATVAKGVGDLVNFLDTRVK